MEVTIKPFYGYVLMLCIIMALQNFITGLITGVNSRTRVLNKDWMKRNFKKEHDKAFGVDQAPLLNELGLPDSGSGRYASFLSYKKWFIMNLWIRSQGNCNEYIFQTIVFTLISGINHPYSTIFVVAFLIPARFLYTVGYIQSPYERFVGYQISYLCTIILFVGTLITIIPMIKQSLKQGVFTM